MTFDLLCKVFRLQAIIESNSQSCCYCLLVGTSLHFCFLICAHWRGDYQLTELGILFTREHNREGLFLTLKLSRGSLQCCGRRQCKEQRTGMNIILEPASQT